MFRNGNSYNSTRHAIADILLCYAKLVDLWVYLVAVNICMYIVNACNIIFYYYIYYVDVDNVNYAVKTWNGRNMEIIHSQFSHCGQEGE